MDDWLRAVPRYMKWALSSCTWCQHPVLGLDPDPEYFGGRAWVCLRCEHFVSWAT
jgi:hypothetical protein